MYVGKVKPTMKEKTKNGKEFYHSWFVLEGKGPNRGSVIDAYCVCLEGRDGGCKHVAAALYSLDDLLTTHGLIMNHLQRKIKIEHIRSSKLLTMNHARILSDKGTTQPKTTCYLCN